MQAVYQAIKRAMSRRKKEKEKWSVEDYVANIAKLLHIRFQKATGTREEKRRAEGEKKGEKIN